MEENYQEGQHLFEEVQSSYATSAEASLGLVFAACGLGDYGLARRRLQEALGFPSPYRTPATADLVLPAAALIFAQEGERERASELFALTFHLPVCPKGLLEKWPLLTRFQSEVEAGLSPDVFAAARARGQVLDFEAAVASLQEYFHIGHLASGRLAISPIGTDQPLVEPLTERELEVLELIAAGLTNQKIAEELVIALGTVKAHTSSIYGKLGVSSRTQAVARAREMKLLK